MTFSRAKLTTNYNYFIGNEILLRSTGPIKDFGILFDPKLKFDCHINMIINKLHKLSKLEAFINHSNTQT